MTKNTGVGRGNNPQSHKNTKRGADHGSLQQLREGGPAMSRPDSEYLEYDPFFGDEGELTCRNAAIRTARKEYPCLGGLGDGDGHTIKPGDRYRYETARVDGDFWSTYRICLTCLDRCLQELEDEDDDE